MLIQKNCKQCSKSFSARLADHKRNRAKFCCQSCSAKHMQAHKTPPIANSVCAFCKKRFYRPKSKLRNSKSGLYFCSRKHKDLAQRIGGIKEIQPNHYNNGIANYRVIAFREYPHKCNRCFYDAHPEVLVIHHIDRNRTNNNVFNLEVLCPTCHEVEHFTKNDGRWGKKLAAQPNQLVF